MAGAFSVTMLISLPVIGEGVAAKAPGLQTAGIAFSVAVALVAAIALATMLPTHDRRVRTAQI